MKAILACAALTLWIAPAAAQSQPTSTPLDARAVFMNREGKSIGTATLIDTPNGVLVRADIASLPPGPHGFHIHEVGRCDAAGGFESAGGHYNPLGAQHGYWVQGGPHAGDLPNQTVGQDGKLIGEVFNPHVRFDGQAALLDQDGSSIVVHSTADDYRTQPSGGAGDRIACGVIRRNQ